MYPRARGPQHPTPSPSDSQFEVGDSYPDSVHHVRYQSRSPSSQRERKRILQIWGALERYPTSTPFSSFPVSSRPSFQKLTRSAIEQYQLACTADPTKPNLLFNLSAAQFETGQYVASLFSTKAAIDLCDPKEDGELLAKLWLRRAKCELHVRNFKEAEAAAKKVKEFQPGDVIRKDAVQLEKAAVVSDFYEHIMLEEEILAMTLETPKYRPSL